MATVVTRAGKGSALTFAEMDANITNLNNDKAETSSPTLTTPTFSGNTTVTGGTFTTRGLTDSATATALTLSGSGANSVTIANSADDPTIGVTGNRLKLAAISLIGADQTDYFLLRGDTGVVNLAASGGSTDVNIQYQTKGAGHHYFYNDTGGLQVQIINTDASDRYITLTGSNGGTPTIGTSAGDLLLSPGGGALVSFGTYAAKAAEAFAGYITIKDAAGNSRKVMVCA